MKKEKYISGLDMEQFKHLPEISHYNSNYYLGFDKDLLYGKSDEWQPYNWNYSRTIEYIKDGRLGYES